MPSLSAPTVHDVAARGDLLTQAQAAEHLNVTVRTIRRWIAAGELTGVRLGSRAIRVPAAEVVALGRPLQVRR